MTLAKRPLHKAILRWTGRILVGLLGLIGLAVVLGAGYEAYATRRDARRFPPPGRMVDIGGRRIHLDCRGEGSPTVVFESGLDAGGSLAWSAVHDQIAAQTRACAYDRAGIMWSDPKEGIQDAHAVVADLYATLRAADIHAPLLLVAHSLGGPLVVSYTRAHPEDVAGLVFVDASHPDQIERFAAVGVPRDAASGQTAVLRWLSALSWTGVTRLVPKDNPGTGPEVNRVMAAYFRRSLVGVLSETESLDRILAQGGELRDLGSRPIVVLTAMAPLPQEVLSALQLTPEEGLRFQQVWLDLQSEEASWSSRSRHEQVPDASHYIQLQRPDRVVAAVEEVLAALRADEGSTDGPG